jgi:hypothetical protein
MSLKIGLHIVNQIYDCAKAGYEVKFCPDFDGMLRIEFTKELVEGFYEHSHLGYPDCPREVLESAIIKSLNEFRESHGINA